ncbi:acyl carrier protein [Acaryochloris marina]|uniref:acyl carrier protein n=1 Tax=Acaryochloris marina TaxID=155978 RepID=UPI001BAEA9CF|nr:acyl carrier protein [Acaryochloris marina]QUY40945.1 acyl carrier protein [Acaryochloris marina S15]
MPIQDNYQSTVAVAEAQSQGTVSPLQTSPTLADIQAWLKKHLATSLEMSPEEIDIDVDFIDYGMNSVEVVNVSGELEHFLGRRLDPMLVLDYSNIRELSEHLVTDNEGSSPTTSALPADADELLSKLDVLSDDEVDGLLNAMLSEHNVAHE